MLATAVRPYRARWDRCCTAHDAPMMEVLVVMVVQGQEPFVWGTTLLSDGLLFASDRCVLCCAVLCLL